ncbi:hypothetical protein NDU88_000489 [Pleurodeles waltl]|uniref:Uncharacterized protein n=1 Tax=Pleurodeles waltl TaxID=8319 RepID=A0AAV7TFM2_PLEWA|nr:hypothetical protein NDU88_000489 [Pleurodeles waltl]
MKREDGLSEGGEEFPSASSEREHDNGQESKGRRTGGDDTADYQENTGTRGEPAEPAKARETSVFRHRPGGTWLTKNPHDSTPNKEAPIKDKGENARKERSLVEGTYQISLFALFCSPIA